MPDHPQERFACPHCGASIAWEKPGIGSFIAADILATLVALPFLIFGVIGFVIAVCAAAVGLLYFFHQSTSCSGCGKRVSRAQAQAGGA